MEFGRAFHPPYEVPIVIAVNGVLMAGLWFLAPKAWDNALFSLHGTLAFPLLLAGWMIRDVPATNVLGPDHRRTRVALDDPLMSAACCTPRTWSFGLLSCPCAWPSP